MPEFRKIFYSVFNGAWFRCLRHFRSLELCMNTSTECSAMTKAHLAERLLLKFFVSNAEIFQTGKNFRMKFFDFLWKKCVNMFIFTTKRHNEAVLKVWWANKHRLKISPYIGYVSSWIDKTNFLGLEFEFFTNRS